MRPICGGILPYAIRITSNLPLIATKVFFIRTEKVSMPPLCIYHVLRLSDTPAIMAGEEFLFAEYVFQY